MGLRLFTTETACAAVCFGCKTWLLPLRGSNITLNMTYHLNCCYHVTCAVLHAARWEGNNGPRPTDYDGPHNLLKACPKSLKRFVFVTSAGVERRTEMPWAILNTFGESSCRCLCMLRLYNRPCSKLQCTSKLLSPQHVLCLLRHLQECSSSSVTMRWQVRSQTCRSAKLCIPV
jgi:hypothetical protein